MLLGSDVKGGLCAEPGFNLGNQDMLVVGMCDRKEKDIGILSNFTFFQG